MPITPFHMGPAALVKGVGRGYFSFVVFGITNVFIDLESGYNFLAGNWPMHTFLHTLVGATLAAVICTGIGKPLGEWVLRLWNRWLSPAQARWLGVEPRIPWLAAATGAFIGAYSHVLLDSIMHTDMQPAAPFSAANPIWGWVSIPTLHWICVGTGVLGVLVLLPAWLKNRKS